MVLNPQSRTHQLGYQAIPFRYAVRISQPIPDDRIASVNVDIFGIEKETGSDINVDRLGIDKTREGDDEKY